jgi:hypothetical protein
MLHHDMLLQAWRRIVHRSGVSTVGEPTMDHLRNAAPTNRENRSDILAVLSGGLVVADVLVSHPAATSYSRAAARTAAAAAASRNALKQRQYRAGCLPAALSSYPLSVESFKRFGVSAMQFLNALAEAALASSAAGTDVTKSAFISRALPELGVTLDVRNELVYREAMHVYAAPGGTRTIWACMCWLLMSRSFNFGYFCHAFLLVT